jgi:hypothetical protein
VVVPFLPQPAQALEQIDLRLPLLDTTFTVKLSELEKPGQLLSGTSDLAELDQATNGAVGRRLLEFFNYPLPLQTKAVVGEAAGSALFNQALLLVSAIGGIDGLPANLDGKELSAVLERAAAKGPLTMRTVLQSLPGRTATVDLQLALYAAQRLANQQLPADRLIAANPAAGGRRFFIAASALASARSSAVGFWRGGSSGLTGSWTTGGGARVRWGASPGPANCSTRRHRLASALSSLPPRQPVKSTA